MGITSAWAISAHEDDVIAELAPRFLPVIEAERNDPAARRRWDAWRRAPLPDYRTWYAGDDGAAASAVESFRELTCAGERVIDACYGGGEDDFYVVDDVWGRQADPAGMFLAVHSKEYAVASLFHAIGPRRAAELPGWCGDFLLDSHEVRRSLPRVEAALTFDLRQRVAVDDQDWLDYLPGEENVVDGPVRVWRHAAAEGLGLCGLSLHLY
ncbi:hypothetical protein AB0M39_19865 [Streptomyces sp. NPDC051907]|uniref:hypothetical protein n=1 Tax=Streptomyces sp. NPDC051907 TaxID=3155284 RepID=UPI0034231670